MISGYSAWSNENKLLTEIKSFIDDIYPKVKGFREHLHMHPELSLEEFETMKFVTDQLDNLGVPYIDKIAGTGVTAFIRGKHGLNVPHVLLRGDMDALPITEENETEYCSKIKGKMHACGHDVHTSNLWVLLRSLKV